ARIGARPASRGLATGGLAGMLGLHGSNLGQRAGLAGAAPKTRRATRMEESGFWSGTMRKHEPVTAKPQDTRHPELAGSGFDLPKTVPSLVTSRATPCMPTIDCAPTE